MTSPEPRPSVPAPPRAEGETKPAPGAPVPPPANALTPEEQMAAFEQELKEQDWGHQPC